MIKQILTGSILLALGVTSAQAKEDAGFYVGAAVGQDTLKDEDSTLGFKFDGSDTAGKIFAGYQFNRYVAVEAAYIDGGEPDDTILGIQVKAKADGGQGSVIGMLPIGEVVSLYARAGVLVWNVKLRATDGFTVVEDKEDGSDFMWGGGINIKITPHLHARAEYEYADLGGTDATVITAGAYWKF